MKRTIASWLAFGAVSTCWAITGHISWATSAALAGEVRAGSGSPLEVARIGARPAVEGGAENFTGKVTVEARFQQPSPARVGGATVAFQPGARTAWHTHPLGQTLIVMDGVGWVQREGAPKQTIRRGDVVVIPPNARHWHGAAADSRMTHVAVAESLDGNVVTWMEQVTEAQYLSDS